MKFSPKPSDACFTTSINSFGKILVTKVNPTKSKVVVTSSVCDQGEELQFQIQLYSSTGIPIIDENVSVHLKDRGQILKSVHCSIGTPSSTFTGKWVPDEPLQLFWIVVSNGIELETLEGMIEVKATETQQGTMLLWFRVYRKKINFTLCKRLVLHTNQFDILFEKNQLFFFANGLK